MHALMSRAFKSQAIGYFSETIVVEDLAVPGLCQSDFAGLFQGFGTGKNTRKMRKARGSVREKALQKTWSAKKNRGFCRKNPSAKLLGIGADCGIGQQNIDAKGFNAFCDQIQESHGAHGSGEKNGETISFAQEGAQAVGEKGLGSLQIRGTQRDAFGGSCCA